MVENISPTQKNKNENNSPYLIENLSLQETTPVFETTDSFSRKPQFNLKLPQLFLFIFVIATLFVGVYSLQIMNFDLRRDASEITTNSDTALLATLLDELELNNINTADYGEEQDFYARIDKLDCCATSYVLSSLESDIKKNRFELVFDERIEHVVGLGMEANTDQVYLEDFTDLSFGPGHYSYFDVFNGDIARLKTPMMVFPEKNLIVAYIQPDVSQVRLTRTDTTTTVVFKKDPASKTGSAGELLLIRGSSLADAYSQYNQALRSRNFFFKKPHFNTFGLAFETFPHFMCRPSLNDVKNAVNEFKSRKVNLSFITIGSGYWDSTDFSGCGGNNDYEQEPTTESFAIGSHFGEKQEVVDFINSLKEEGTYTTIGMRHIFAPQEEYIQRARVLFGTEAFDDSDIFLNDQLYDGERPSNNVRLLNIHNPLALDRYLELVLENYGPISGFKEDNMIFQNQITNRDRKEQTDRVNFSADLISKAYKHHSEYFNNDFLLIGRNDFFSVATDAQNSQGFAHATNKNQYFVKYLLDSSLFHVVSGFPHPKIELHVAPCQSGSTNFKETFRSFQLLTFTPVTMHSCQYWKNPDVKQVAANDFYAQLRMRLHKYVYDKALDWYSSGVPTLMQPLFFTESWKSDPEVMKLYTKVPNNAKDIEKHPRNTFMFGNALLVSPVFSNKDELTIYLPEGRWKSFIKKSETYTGKRYIQFKLETATDYPVFLKEGEILVIGEASNPDKLLAYAFLDESAATAESAPYTFYEVNNTSTTTESSELVVRKKENSYTLHNLTNGKSKPMTADSFGKGWFIAPLDEVL